MAEITLDTVLQAIVELRTDLGGRVDRFATCAVMAERGV
jgi:hypothetical protein